MHFFKFAPSPEKNLVNHKHIHTHTMKRYLCVTFIFLYSIAAFSQDIFHEDTEVALRKLDSLVLNNEMYVKEKSNKLNHLKRIDHALTPEERYWKYKNIYQEYKVFNSDSALVWLEKANGLAKGLRMEKEVLRNRIEKGYVLAATGLLVESMDQMKGINSATLPDEICKEYYSEMSYLYSHLHQYSMSDNPEIHPGMRNYYQIQQLTYIDSLQQSITPEDEDYLWYMAWKYRETDSLGYYRRRLEEELTGKYHDERKDAMLLYALAHLYYEENDPTAHINALAYSAMADIRYANREIASLQELAYTLFRNGDIDRSYTYISLCLKNSQIYKARIRAIEIGNLMDAIYKMNMERNLNREKKLRVSFLALLIIALIAGIAIVIIAIQFKKLRGSHLALKTSNDLLNRNVVQLTSTQQELECANLKLKHLNGEMRESNRVKEEYIGHVFNLCSDYLSKMDQTQKSLKRKLSSGKKEELAAWFDSPILIEKEVKAFYHNFDAIFLNLYPDFIEEFNKLLRPEERIVLKSNELLNTELRIYALVRLGINDSTKIAEFLRISVQTVYNNRLRIRNKLIIPKEEFSSRLQKLGTINLS